MSIMSVKKHIYLLTYILNNLLIADLVTHFINTNCNVECEIYKIIVAIS